MNGRCIAPVVIGLGRMGSTIDDERGNVGAPGCTRPRTLPATARSGSRWRPAPTRTMVSATRTGRSGGCDTLYADYREMMERERPDLVSICTSARPRARVHARRRGDRRGARPQGDLGGEAAGHLAGGGQTAWWPPAGRRASSSRWAAPATGRPPYDRMRELVDAGELGDLLQIVEHGRGVHLPQRQPPARHHQPAGRAAGYGGCSGTWTRTSTRRVTTTCRATATCTMTAACRAWCACCRAARAAGNSS